MDEITLYDAIRQMRELTARGESFSFTHATYNRATMHSDGIREVKRAKCRPAASGDDVKNSNYKLFYYDEYYHENRVCWQMLIMYFKGRKVKLT